MEHRRQQLRGETLRPIVRHRFQNKGRVCRFEGCDRPAKAWGLCNGHNDQRLAGVEMYALNDWTRFSEKQKAYWAAMTPEARAARLEAMHATPYERTEEWSRRASEQRRQAWAAGQIRTLKPKVCRGCDVTYNPTSGRQVYCTVECRLLCTRAARYGMTNDELAALLVKQDGVCALCRRPECGFFRGQPLVVDHCHTTGRVRGLLCGDCNTALGRFGDDPARLRAAADYLERT